jgi:hypothetical protein
MKRLIKTVILSSGLALVAGCGGNGGSPSAPAQAEPPTDHAAEAAQAINEQNMDRHLEALEAEILADEEL